MDNKELIKRLRNFASDCRGSMWQSRDETIALCDAAADALEAAQAQMQETMKQTILSNPHMKTLVHALKVITSHRQKCHEHDADCGHELRTFDQEDVRLMEWAAQSALAALKEAKMNKCCNQGRDCPLRREVNLLAWLRNLFQSEKNK